MTERAVEKFKDALRQVRGALFEHQPNLDKITDTLWMPTGNETVLDYINYVLDEDDYVDPSQRVAPVPIAAVNPIHCVPAPEGDLLPGWYFWDETWCNRHGPFATREETEAAMKAYADSL